MTTAGKNTYDRKNTYVQDKLHMYVTERSYLKATSAECRQPYNSMSCGKCIGIL